MAVTMLLSASLLPRRHLISAFVSVVGWILFGSLHFSPVAADDSRFAIISLDSVLEDDVYHLDARLDLSLGEEMYEALKNGVPLVIVLETEVLEPQLKWFNTEVVHLEQRYELRYHPLTRQFLETNLNTGIQVVHPTLSSALSNLSRIENLPLLEADVIRDREDALVRIRVRLDVSQLPLPLRVRAYTDPGWRVRSPWVRWPLK
jgi:hypothetical protein